MNRFTKFLMIAFTLGTFAFNGQMIVSRPTLKRFMITNVAPTVVEGQRLSAWLVEKGFDVPGMNWREGQIEVITDQDGIAFLKSQGLNGEVIEERGFAATVAPDPRYLNPDKVAERLKDLQARHSDVSRLKEIGRSTQNRPIWAILISTTPKLGDPAAAEKATLVFDGMHHAREIMTSEVVLDAAESILAKVDAKDEKTMRLLQRWNVWVVPMLNVDGNNIVWTSDNLWRKNAYAPRAGVVGVDLNRNYDYKWSGCRGSSNSEGAQDYHGPSVASEPETKALMSLVNESRPAAALSYHSYSELVLYPLGCSNTFPTERALFEKVAKELADRLPSDGGRGNYTPGTPWQLLYPVDGDSMDYIYAKTGALAFTFEINQAFQPKYEVREPTVKKHRIAWSYYWDRVDQNILKLRVVDARNPKNTSARIAMGANLGDANQWTIETNSAGNFFKVLDPGHYDVTVIMPDGRKVTKGVDMAGAPQMVTVTVP